MRISGAIGGVASGWPAIAIESLSWRSAADEGQSRRAALKARGPLESGTRSVKAFRVDANTIVGVYLLTPSPPEDASVLEAIVRVK